MPFGDVSPPASAPTKKAQLEFLLPIFGRKVAGDRLPNKRRNRDGPPPRQRLQVSLHAFIDE